MEFFSFQVDADNLGQCMVKKWFWWQAKSICFFFNSNSCKGERWDTLLASASNLRILLAHLLHDWKLEVVTFPGFWWILWHLVIIEGSGIFAQFAYRSSLAGHQSSNWGCGCLRLSTLLKFGEESNLLSTPAFSNPSFGWTTTPFAAREGVAVSSGLLALPDIALRCFILTEYNITVS